MKKLILLSLFAIILLFTSCVKVLMKLNGARDLMTPVTEKEIQKFTSKIPLQKDDFIYVVEDSVWLRFQKLKALTQKIYDKTGNCLKINPKTDSTERNKKVCAAPFYNFILNYQKNSTPRYLPETILDEAKKWQNTDYTNIDNAKLLEKVAQYDLVLVEYFFVNAARLSRVQMREIQTEFIDKRKDLKVLYIKVCADRQAKWNLSEEQLIESWKKDTTGLKVKVKKKK